MIGGNLYNISYFQYFYKFNNYYCTFMHILIYHILDKIILQKINNIFLININKLIDKIIHFMKNNIALKCMAAHSKTIFIRFYILKKI
jgi:hypothetical protein